jgi:hypothetical protein
MVDINKIAKLNDQLNEIDVRNDIDLLQKILDSITELTSPELEFKGYFNEVLELQAMLQRFNFSKEYVAHEAVGKLKKLKKSQRSI